MANIRTVQVNRDDKGKFAPIGGDFSAFKKIGANVGMNKRPETNTGIMPKQTLMKAAAKQQKAVNKSIADARGPKGQAAIKTLKANMNYGRR